MGNIIVGRNIQSFGAGYIDRTRRICLFEPAEGLAFVTIGPAGITGAVDGMNTNGLVVCFTPLPVVADSLRNEIFALDGMPLVFMLRRVLQYGTSFDEAINIITRAPRTRSGMVLLADAQTNQVVFVEFTPHDYAIKEMEETTLWGTNHFQSPLFKGNFYKNLGTSYQERFFGRDTEVSDVLLSYLGRLDLSTTVALLRSKNSKQFSQITYMGDHDHSLCNLNTLSSIIFMPDELKFWLPPAGYYPVTENRYVGFTLYREFDMEYEKDISLQNAPASGLTNDDLFRTMQSVAAADRLTGQGDYQAAAAAYQQALARISGYGGNPRNTIHTLEKLADAQFRAGDYNGCLAAYDKILALVPKLPPGIVTRELKAKVLTKKGMVYDLLKMRDQALACYREAAGTGDIYYTGWRDRAEKLIKKKYEKE
jgi:tetratricopeptide (TPR) repeat protein